MKGKILGLILMVCMSFGCSSILGSLSSNEIVLTYNKVSGDQLQIVYSKNELSNIVNTKTSETAGFLKVLTKYEKYENEKYFFNTTNIQTENNLLILNFELEIDNRFLEQNDLEQDKLIIWYNDNCLSLYKGVFESNPQVKEEEKETSTIFNFYLPINQSSVEVSIQTLNVIQ